MRFRTRIIFSIIIILFCQATRMAGQTSPSAEDKGPKKIASPKDHIVLDLSYDSYAKLPKDIDLTIRSLGVNVFLMWDYPIGRGPFSIAAGAGISTHAVHSNGKILYSLDGKYTSIVPLTTEYKTNKLTCHYAEIPVELRIRTRTINQFKLTIGGKIGYAFNVHTKFEDDDGKIKVYKIKNIEPLRYGLTFRIGYNKWNLQGFYGLSELFMKGRGEPGMAPYSFGVGMLLY
jgi:outer membrane protein with beta-barrel domain